MRTRAIHGVLALVALSAGLLSCSRSATSARLVFQIQRVQVDQLVLTVKVGNAIKLSGEKIPLTPGSQIVSGADYVVIFPDEDAGKLLEVTVRGMWNGKEVARKTQTAPLSKDQQLVMYVSLGPLVADGGPDLRTDIRPDWPLLDRQPPDQGCVVGSARCNSNTLITCVVSDAGKSEVSRHCPLGCVTSPSVMCRELIPSNGIPKTFLQAGKNDLLVTSGTVTINSDTGQVIGISGITPVLGMVKQTNGLEIRVMAFKTIQVQSGAALKVVGARALALVASGSTTVEGEIAASGVGSTPGPGGGRGATSSSTTAGGPGGGGNGANISLLIPILNIVGGGGGGGHADSGGEGGHGQFAAQAANGGKGGPGHGLKELSPLSAGGGGGHGGGAKGVVGGPGGGGGGGLQLISAVSITIGTGAGIGGINASGGGGGFSSSIQRGGGGGGAGGGILLEAPVVTLKAGGTIAVNGGGGGGGSGTTSGAKAGADGELGDKQAAGGAASSQGGKGGEGGNGTALPGANGNTLQAGGGGGGAAGHLRINTHSGKTNNNGTVSGLYSEGKVFTNPP